MNMKKVVSVLVLFAVVALGIASLSTSARADEVKMVGVITKIDISGKDATTATATLKDNKTGNLVVITVNDDLTLDKFKDHRIVEGDEIRCKYEAKDGKNISSYFRKTAGC
jgi:Cu/Ag efflux protein CusF